jgi:hypothetical protein
MPSISAFLARLRIAVRHGHVWVSAKAIDEALDDLGWERTDILDMLTNLASTDFERTEPSMVRPEDLIWVFCPDSDQGTLWIRLIERAGIVVVSFHLAGEP